MKKVSVKRIMLIVAIFAAICVISSINYASSDVRQGDISELMNQMGITGEIQNITRIDPAPTNTETPTANTNTETPETNTNVANLTPLTTNTNTNTNTETTLPKTGIDDTMLWVLIAVCVIAAGYTYKKVRDYNV